MPQTAHRTLPDEWVCIGCGDTAANCACIRSLDEANATDRDFIEVNGEWEGNICKKPPEGCFAYTEDGVSKFEVCGNCGDAVWKPAK